MFLPLVETTSSRALWNLNSMAECRLGYSALVYNNYGCWCGVGGAHTPVDGIDDCCRRHDNCYDVALDKHDCKGVFEEYVKNYKWKCDKINITSSEPMCLGSEDACRDDLCHCDKMVVDCWSQCAKPSERKRCSHND
ncbi:unnamed protein product [Bursaphelenchus okinawaensis]|uniref:Phospholipase A2 n=1 Tax=Bursaphelenchus okinawaensis TaxID=465554 RepID=A0A811KU55_9BILA|nr:unnamed protein product [Bursaphelenchus okinawaensis]CAG9112344.1 unnamed protein product [Bursaphelenchus okinawaensis]